MINLQKYFFISFTNFLTNLNFDFVMYFTVLLLFNVTTVIQNFLTIFLVFVLLRGTLDWRFFAIKLEFSWLFALHSTTGVNFINILLARFCTKVLCKAFLLLHFFFVIFWWKYIDDKRWIKMLMKLTPGVSVMHFVARRLYFSRSRHQYKHYRFQNIWNL